MTQLAFDLNELMGVTAPRLACGIHAPAETEDHIAQCMHGVCPCCGDRLHGWFDLEINHSIGNYAKGVMCAKQWLTLNHTIRCAMILTGTWLHDPQTNCFAGGEDHVHPEQSGKFFRNGAPIECVHAEYEQKRSWLLSSGLSPELIPEVAA